MLARLAKGFRLGTPRGGVLTGESAFGRLPWRLFPLRPCRLAPFQLAPCLLRQLFVIGADSVKLVLLKILEVKKSVVRGFIRPNQFVKLDVDCLGVAILRVLNEENHEECHNGRAGVYDELPCIAEAKYWP